MTIEENEKISNSCDIIGLPLITALENVENFFCQATYIDWTNKLDIRTRLDREISLKTEEYESFNLHHANYFSFSFVNPFASVKIKIN